jgi:hypothetical protein
MRTILLIFSSLLPAVFSASAQKIIFLHHSTGAGVYSGGNVASWIATYNTSHGKNYLISERSYPDTPYPWANYAYDYWNLWINGQCSKTNVNILCMDELTKQYDVIIFKHCFPGASVIADDGKPSVSSGKQTLANYKLQYTALRGLMDQYPAKKFIVWTLAPLHRNATDAASAARAKTFVDWVKNQWLTEDGKNHKNIYVFDFYGLAAELNAAPVSGKVNCLRYDYEGDHNGSDSHPNSLANKTIGPAFAQFIVNAIENVPSFISDIIENGEPGFFPNPANNFIKIINPETVSEVEISNFEGKIMIRVAGCPESVDISGLTKGMYLVRLKTHDSVTCRKLLVN